MRKQLTLCWLRVKDEDKEGEIIAAFERVFFGCRFKFLKEFGEWQMEDEEFSDLVNLSKVEEVVEQYRDSLDGFACSVFFRRRGLLVEWSLKPI